MGDNLHRDEAMCSANHEILDMVCVGFGPASLSIAVALEDWLKSTGRGQRDHAARPNVAFLEKQASFHWHIGMLLHSAKMQISFIKDLATVRDPGSKFTFLNYLKEHGRLRDFARLNTFLPTRVEFADYMRWAAGYFAENVNYDHEVLRVRPVKRHRKVSHFEIESCEGSSGDAAVFYARQVIVGIGGSPAIPAMFKPRQSWIIHSSQYETTIDQIVPTRGKAYKIAVIGSGQSAAEVFDDLSTRLPNAHTTMVFRDSALRPSDDSPFVNEVFDPLAVDTFFQKSSLHRSEAVKRNRSTNYSVVRMELIEKIYKDLVLQQIQQPRSTQQRRRILPSTEITSVQTTAEGSGSILTLRSLVDRSTQTLQFDAIVLATGYTRKAHLDMLQECQDLNVSAGADWKVRRDYSLALDHEKVEKGVGIWLQGCNEETHGLSDSLLSILANRSGELVQSVFGTASEKGDGSVRLTSVL